jgi:hypothetical protein
LPTVPHELTLSFSAKRRGSVDAHGRVFGNPFAFTTTSYSEQSASSCQRNLLPARVSPPPWTSQRTPQPLRIAPWEQSSARQSPR